jgi:hypothetical protein
MDKFLCKITCFSGQIIHIGGLCKKNTAMVQTKKCRQLQALSITRQDDLYDIDYKLAEKISETFDEDVYVVGASIKAEHMTSGYTGGVIGNPAEKPKSAWGEIEYIGHGLYMIARAESPGVAAKCTEQEMNNVMQILMQQFKNKKECVNQIIDYFTVQHIDSYLITADGSGEKGEQIVVCKAGEVYGLSENV